VNVAFTTADAEHLPYPDASFDAVWGNAILTTSICTRPGQNCIGY